jgi:hypothetical protein
VSRDEPLSIYLLLAEVVRTNANNGRTQITRTIETTDESGIFVPLPHN